MGLFDKVFSRGKGNKGEPLPAPDTEFGTAPDAADLEFKDVPGGAAPAVEETNAPLRLGSAIGTRAGKVQDDLEGDFRLPWIGHLSLARQLRILLVVFGGGVALTVFALWQNANTSAIASAQTQIASDALMHSQRIGKAAPNAIQGNVEAFGQLEESRQQLNRDLSLLQRGGEFAGSGIPAAPASMNRTLAAAKNKWVSTDNAAGTIL